LPHGLLLMLIVLGLGLGLLLVLVLLSLSSCARYHDSIGALFDLLSTLEVKHEGGETVAVELLGLSKSLQQKLKQCRLAPFLERCAALPAAALCSRWVHICRQQHKP
jgi:hypothetical protein